MENNKNADHINIYVMSDGISKENRKLLKKQVDRYGSKRQLHIIECDEIIKEFRDSGVPDYRGSYAAYLRIAFEKVVPSDIEKLLYLDSDTLVVGSLSEIFGLDLGENYLAAVSESLSDSVRPLIGFGEDETYFNSGVIMFNVPVWKRDHCAGRIFSMIKNPDIKNPTGGDQDYLNHIARKKKIVISPMYNLQPVHIAFTIGQYRKCFSSGAYYDNQMLEYAISHPVILHTYRFLGMFPWHKDSKHPFTEQFKKYALISEWKDHVDLKKKLSVCFVIERVLYDIIPKGYFLKMFAKIHKEAARRMTLNC